MHVAPLVIAGTSIAGVIAIRIRRILRRRRWLAMIEAGFNELQAAIAGPLIVRNAADELRDLIELRGVTNQFDDELSSCGFRVLGDLVIEAGGAPKLIAVKAYVDSAATTFVYVNAIKIVQANARAFRQYVRRHGTRVVLEFESYSREESWSTRRGEGRAQVEWPPFCHEQVMAPELDLAQMLARHREQLPTDSSVLMKLASIEDMVAELPRVHDRTRAWRAQQSPDMLLDADLRGLLGKHYERLGEVVKRRVSRPLPKAVARS